MSYTDLLMNMDGDVQVSNRSSSSSCKKVLWTKEMERKFLGLLQEQVQLGKKAEGGFKKEAWTAIERRFNAELKMNLSKDNFKNKLKTWKQGYRIMKDLKNTSGFAWNESSQCVDVDDSVWDELLKRREFKNAKVYKRQPFQYYNELAIIVGNDIVEGTIAATAQETEEGKVMDDAADLNDEEDATYHGIDSPSYHSATDLANDGIDTPTSNLSGGSGRENPSTSSTRRPKRKKASMVGSMDAICEVIRELGAGLKEPLKIENSALQTDADNVYNALKSIPHLTQGTMLDAYEHFLGDPAKAKGFLRMDEGERIAYITRKFGGL